MLSHYASKLTAEAKERYLTKLKEINDVDPYTLTPSVLSSTVFPIIEATDLVNYLVLGTSCYTAKQFKAYRSLEAYNQFHCGWVSDVSGCLISNKYVVLGKVRVMLCCAVNRSKELAFASEVTVHAVPVHCAEVICLRQYFVPAMSAPGEDSFSKS